MIQPSTATPSPSFVPRLLEHGADPYVHRHSDGYYYLSQSNGSGIYLIRARSIPELANGEQKVVWTPPASGPYSKEIWAPEIHFLADAWYIYFAGDDGDNQNHRMWVLENTDADPFAGEFVFRGKVADNETDRWAIDGTVLAVDNRLYFIWSGWEGMTNVQQDIYIAPLSDPCTISGPRVLISQPELPWETIGTPHVNEGPQVLLHNDSIHILYSASGSWTDAYCLGRLTATCTADLLAPASWKKHPEPVFESGNGIVAPGHASFTTDGNGKDWIVYHAARHPGAGWDRYVRAQTFIWNTDDTPNFGPPAI